MSYPKVNDPIAKDWFDQALKLEPGQSLFILCFNVSEQKTLKTKLYGLRHYYSDNFDSQTAELLSFSLRKIEGQLYVEIKKRPTSPRVGFKLSSDGHMERIEVTDREQLRRLISFYILEGKEEEEITRELKDFPQEEIHTIYWEIKGGE